MTPNMESIVSKLRKLDALRSRAATEAEAVNAAQRIQDLLTRHNLDMNILNEPATHEGYAQVAEEDEATEYRFTSRVHPYDQLLASAACKMTDTLYYVRRDVGQTAMKVMFVGLKANVETAVMLYRYFQSTAYYMLDARFKAGEIKGSQCRPYRMGVARRIYQMVVDYRAAQTSYQTVETTALVKLSSAVAQNYLKNVIKPSGEIKFNGAVNDVKAYRLGYQDGSNADILKTSQTRMIA